MRSRFDSSRSVLWSTTCRCSTSSRLCSTSSRLSSFKCAVSSAQLDRNRSCACLRSRVMDFSNRSSKRSSNRSSNRSDKAFFRHTWSCSTLFVSVARASDACSCRVRASSNCVCKDSVKELRSRSNRARIRWENLSTSDAASSRAWARRPSKPPRCCRQSSSKASRRLECSARSRSARRSSAAVRLDRAETFCSMLSAMLEGAATTCPYCASSGLPGATGETCARGKPASAGMEPATGPGSTPPGRPTAGGATAGPT
mmetsp:Transcript_95462/g.269955  ORF Transcript_95462/g.269955 Transcript_95462/m.269955 type:complete len:257 (+) Transcript_95462:687-1457(+)